MAFKLDWRDLLDGVNAREGTWFASVGGMLTYLRCELGSLEKVAEYLGIGYGTLWRRVKG